MLPWQRFCQGALGRDFQFFVLTQDVFMSIFLVQTRNQRVKIDYCAKFQPDWTKDKEAKILTSNDTKNCFMTSYLPHSDDVIKIFLLILIDFLTVYHYAKFGGD